MRGAARHRISLQQGIGQGARLAIHRRWRGVVGDRRFQLLRLREQLRLGGRVGKLGDPLAHRGGEFLHLLVFALADDLAVLHRRAIVDGDVVE